MEYQCNKLTVILHSDEVESAHTKMRLSKTRWRQSKFLNRAEVNMSSVGDVEISTEQLTVCESTVAAMSA